MKRALIVEDQDLMRLALMAELKANFADGYIMRRADPRPGH